MQPHSSAMVAACVGGTRAIVCSSEIASSSLSWGTAIVSGCSSGMPISRRQVRRSFTLGQRRRIAATRSEKPADCSPSPVSSSHLSRYKSSCFAESAPITSAATRASSALTSGSATPGKRSASAMAYVSCIVEATPRTSVWKTPSGNACRWRT